MRPDQDYILVDLLNWVQVVGQHIHTARHTFKNGWAVHVQHNFDTGLYSVTAFAPMTKSATLHAESHANLTKLHANLTLRDIAELE